MPKLDTPTAKRVNAADTTGGGGFTVVDEDTYVLKLTKCTIAPKQNVNGDTYWVWEFEIVSGSDTGDKFKGKGLRTNTTISETSDWFLKQMFDAFSVKPNVDTDTLLGKEIEAYVTQQPQASGRNKGKMRNDLQSPAPVGTSKEEDDTWADDTAKDATGAPDDDDF